MLRSHIAECNCKRRDGSSQANHVDVDLRNCARSTYRRQRATDTLPPPHFLTSTNHVVSRPSRGHAHLWCICSSGIQHVYVFRGDMRRRSLGRYGTPSRKMPRVGVSDVCRGPHGLQSDCVAVARSRSCRPGCESCCGWLSTDNCALHQHAADRAFVVARAE